MLHTNVRKDTKGEFNKDNFSVLLLVIKHFYHLVIMESIFHNHFYLRVTNILLTLDYHFTTFTIFKNTNMHEHIS